MYKVAPLPGTFLLTSILGFIISGFYVMDWSRTWGVAFSIVFILMFIASFISMSKADAEEQIRMDGLQ